MQTNKKRLLGLLGVVVFGMSVTACGGNADSPSSSAPAAATSAGGEANASGCPEGNVTIKISTFNNFGYGAPTDAKPGADLWSKYEAKCPNVKIEETVAASSDDARAAFNTAISTGTGAYDIQAVDIDWMPSIMAQPDKFTDMTPYVGSNDWLDWKIKQATTPDGKLLGMGTDIGPEGICYRADLLKKANMPSDRDAVAELLGGANATWDKYFEVGKEYVQKSGGKAWFDSAAATYQGMVNQIEYSYIDADNNIIGTTNPDIKTAYDKLTAAAVTDKESAGLQQWGDDWNAAFKSDQFATMLCPAWIVNNIKGNAGADFKGWDIANVFPGGGGNWGGSFLVVPTQSKVADAAAKVAAWITAPEQQQAVFEAAANYPSSPTAEAAPSVAGKTEPFLNEAPVGSIFKDRAAAVTVVPYKGAQYFDIQTKMADALNRVDVTKEQSAADSWNTWLNDVKSLS